MSSAKGTVPNAARHRLVASTERPHLRVGFRARLWRADRRARPGLTAADDRRPTSARHLW